MTTVLNPKPALEPNSMRPLVLRARPALRISDDDFFEFCQQNRDLRIEQTATGEWIIMVPTGGETGSSNAEVSRQLGNWARQDDTGIACDSSTGYIFQRREAVTGRLLGPAFAAGPPDPGSKKEISAAVPGFCCGAALTLGQSG